MTSNVAPFRSAIWSPMSSDLWEAWGLTECKHWSEARGRAEQHAHYLKFVRLLEKAMISWIMYVVRSVTCGRAVKPQPRLASSPSRVCCVSEEPCWWVDGGNEQQVDNEPTAEGAFPHWLLSLTTKMFLSIGWEKQKLKLTQILKRWNGAEHLRAPWSHWGGKTPGQRSCGGHRRAPEWFPLVGARAGRQWWASFSSYGGSSSPWSPSLTWPLQTRTHTLSLSVLRVPTAIPMHTSVIGCPQPHLRMQRESKYTDIYRVLGRRPTFLAHAYGLAFTETAGLALATVFLSYTAFIQEWTVKLRRPLYGTSETSQN